MPNAERSKKRKANLLSESAVQCQKLSDLFKFHESHQSVSVSVAIQNPEATNKLNTLCKSSINENGIITPDKKVINPQNLGTYANEPEMQPSGSSTVSTPVSNSNTTVAEHDANSPRCELSDCVPETATVLPTVEPSAKKLKSEKARKSVSFYKGVKLDLQSLLKNNNELERYDAIKDSKKRVHLACKLCRQYIDEAKKYSRNGTVPIATGVRADGEDRLKLIVDHLQSEAHNAVKNLDKLHEEWDKGSDKHPWLKVLKTHEADTVKLLVGMAFDVYNDSLCETAAANSWPSRSLTHMAANRLISLMRDEGPDAKLPSEFVPSASDLHYRDPVYYREMLESIYAVEVKRVAQMLQECIAFSIQIDGSLSKQMEDNKFTSCRMVMLDGTVKTVFLLMHSPDANGAEGLLEAVNKSIKLYGCSDSPKLMGITTDGESANTGRKAGLWKLLSDQCHREILTMWCCAHRSDLAAESIISTVPELKLWKANLLALATSFRTSKNKTKMLISEYKDAKQFPRHHDVRFAQHQVQLIDAILSNIDGCKAVWSKLQQHGDRKEKADARGFTNTWNDRQIWITALLGDILDVFQVLQKQFQRDDLLLCDIMTIRDGALRKIELMKAGPFPGKRESKSNLDTTSPSTGRGLNNQYVTTSHRNTNAIRVEIVEAAYNFLAERLDPEQDAVLVSMKALLSARTMQEFITSGILLSGKLLPGEDGTFADEVCEQWNTISDVPYLPTGADLGCSLSVRLRQLLPVTAGLVQKVLSAIATLSPHSMQTERIVSHHNLIVDDHRTAMNSDTINARLHIALNGVGTAHFDPRSAVVHFLKSRERRKREPTVEIYSQRDFVAKFFRKSGHFF